MGLRWFVAIAIVSTAFSGCLAGEEPSAKSADAADGTGASATTSAANDTTPQPNAAPAANLTADPQNGSVPLIVNFTISASDIDGDALNWSLDADLDGTADASGNGTEGLANFTYLVPGSYNATLNVTDGTNTTSVVVAINATAADAALAPPPLAEYSGSGTIGGAYALTNDPQFAVQCPGFVLGEDGLGCVFLEFTAGPHDGLPGIVTTNAANFRMAFWDTCDPTGSGTGFGSGASGARVQIPAGTGCAVVWSSNTADFGQTRSFTLQVFAFLPEEED